MLTLAMEKNPKEMELPWPFRGHQEEGEKKKRSKVNPPTLKPIIEVRRDAATSVKVSTHQRCGMAQPDHFRTQQPSAEKPAPLLFHHKPVMSSQDPKV